MGDMFEHRANRRAIERSLAARRLQESSLDRVVAS
jgi:hypothetical protein